MDDFRPRRVAATDNREMPQGRTGHGRAGLAERPDRLALWAVLVAVIAMIAGAASADASSGGVGADSDSSGGTTAGNESREGDRDEGDRDGEADDGAATDCTTKDRARACDGFARLDFSRQRATWYGPGFFGNETACGQTLTRRTQGVAHKKLPCGAQVVLRYKGRYVRTKVIDRGPYANRAKWDLTQATARALRFETTGDVSVARPGR